MKYAVNRNISGFTLIETIVVILILGILAVVIYPVYTSYIDKARIAEDKLSLGILNDATKLYYVYAPSPNPFETVGNSNTALLQALISAALLSEIAEPAQKDVSFVWDFGEDVWLLDSNNVSEDEVTLGTGGFSGYLVGSFSGNKTEVIIPKIINGVTVTAIYQDVFNGKSLTSVNFDDESSITRIHARAFKNNSLTEVVFPTSLQRLDYGAFLDNNITKITIGSNVVLEGNVFQANDLFKNTYYAQGAGTYIYTGGQWVKQ